MRKMATIRTINELLPIEGADRIELAFVDGWSSVIKKGEYQVGDVIIFCEIDSFIPNSIAPFLTREGKEPKEFNGVKGERLRTTKLRGVLSQGLILPLDLLQGSEAGLGALEDGQDVSEMLGVVKYEKPFKEFRGGSRNKPEANFPTLIPKTDQERIQNLTKIWHKYQSEDLTWEVTEKLEGSSCTVYLDIEGKFEVCSRNYSLERSEGCRFWKVAEKYNIEQVMREHGLYGFAIQGELIGPSVQCNIYNLEDVDFYVYDVYKVADGGQYLPAQDRREICRELGLKHVPVVETKTNLNGVLPKHVIDYADGVSRINTKVRREGVVFKCNQDPSLSFKAISNQYLLKEK